MSDRATAGGGAEVAASGGQGHEPGGAAHAAEASQRFQARAVVMDAGDVHRAIWRIAHEVIEHNRGPERLVLVGLQAGGVWMASALAGAISSVSGARVPVGSLDVSYYRDDIGLRPVTPMRATQMPVDLDGAVVVLCDDVIFTGRTVRAALNAIGDIGRPAAVQLAVMVDRGHRELPVRADFVGKNLPTRRSEMVEVTPDGVAIGEIVAERAAGPGPGLELEREPAR